MLNITKNNYATQHKNKSVTYKFVKFCKFYFISKFNTLNFISNLNSTHFKIYKIKTGFV